MGKLFSIIIISCLGIIVYSNTFYCSFHFGDIPFIVNNPSIRNIHNLFKIWEFFPCRFVTFLTLALNYHFSQLNVFGYHLFNLIVHLTTAILVWWFVLLTLSTPAMKEQKITQHADLIALFAGLIFVSHPVQTEAVTYIWQRAASMATMFYLASLCFYVRSRLLQNGTFYYICSLIMAIMAMFSKETAMTLPLIVFLYEITFIKGKGSLNWRYLLPFLFAIFIIPLVTLLNHSEKVDYIQGSVVVHGGLNATQYFLTEFRVMLTYVRLAFLPLDQNLDYDYPIIRNIFELPLFISFFILIIILSSAIRLFSKYRLISFSIFWFFLTLIPEAIPFPVKDVIYEHRLYLPLVGYSILLVSGMYYVIVALRRLKILRYAQDDMRLWMAVMLTIIVSCNSVLTYQRNKIWKDEISLWGDVMRKSPHKARPYFNQGYFYAKQGNLKQAILNFNKAAEITRSDDPNTCTLQGIMNADQGNLTQAMLDFNKAIEINPDYAKAYSNRAVIYYQLKEYDKAWADVRKAERLGATVNPNFIRELKRASPFYVQSP